MGYRSIITIHNRSPYGLQRMQKQQWEGTTIMSTKICLVSKIRAQWGTGEGWATLLPLPHDANNQILRNQPTYITVLTGKKHLYHISIYKNFSSHLEISTPRRF